MIIGQIIDSRYFILFDDESYAIKDKKNSDQIIVNDCMSKNALFPLEILVLRMMLLLLKKVVSLCCDTYYMSI